MERVVEAYTGEYASGKSENAINRALELKEQGHEVTLVDLDTVEPFYTLRPLKAWLEEQGITVIGWGPEDSFGLGETGGRIKPAARWVLRRKGAIILDIGYGVYGARTLNLVEEGDKDPDLQILAVVNTARPMTAKRDDIVEYIRSLGRVDGLVSNTHLGDETIVDVICSGNQELQQAAVVLGIPIVYVAVDERLREEVGAADFGGVPVKFIKRYMPAAMW